MTRDYDFDSGTVSSGIDFDAMTDEEWADMLTAGVERGELDKLVARIQATADSQALLVKLVKKAIDLGGKGLASLL